LGRETAKRRRTVSNYTRQVLTYLQNEYELKIGTEAIRHGSNHRYLAFDYAGRRHRITLQKDAVSGASSVEMKLRDIRRELGEPPKSPPKQKRRLEDMVPKITQTVANSTFADAVALTGTATAATKGVISNHESNKCIYFYLPKEIADCLDVDIKYKVTRVDTDSWEIGPGGNSRLRPSGQRYVIAASSWASGLAGDLGYFNDYPVEYVAVDGHLLVSIIEKKPLRSPIKRNRRRKAKIEEQLNMVIASEVTYIKEQDQSDIVVVEPEYRTEDAIHKVLTTTKPDLCPTSQTYRMKSLLSELKKLEAEGPYRLIKIKGGKWKFWAESVQLEEDE